MSTGPSPAKAPCISSDTALIWNAAGGEHIAAPFVLRFSPLLEECGIVTAKGRLPRIHDLRHSFAVNALLRWYRADADVDAKLPLLATYLGTAPAVQRIITCTSSNRSARRLASGSRIVMANLSARAERSEETRDETASSNLLGAVIRDYFTDHLPGCGERARTRSIATATAWFCCYGFSPEKRR